MGYLYICSNQRCFKGGRAWLYSLGITEIFATNQAGEYKQFCPRCKDTMIQFGPDDPVLLSQLLFQEETTGNNPPWGKRETKRRKSK